jgi:signal transduction histidine kinase
MIERTVQSKSDNSRQQNLEINLIETMASRLNHDLSNPMMIFNNVLEIIKTKNYKCTKQELQKYVNMLATALFRLNIQIKILAHFSSPVLHVKKESVLKVIKKAICDSGIPSSTQIHLPDNDVKIDMDVNQIETVLIILITNALEVMNNKGVIFIRLTEYKDEIILEIEDTGDGIPLELLSKLFEPTYLQRKIGSCLGLPTCKRVIENHGGKISVQTTPFSTVFSLKLVKKLAQ